MTKLRVFKSSLKISHNYIFSDGTPAVFAQGAFRTANPMMIAELDAEIAKGHPHIFIDPNEREIDPKDLDPMVGLRERIIKEYLEQQANAMNPDQDRGTSVPGQMTPTSTHDIAEAAAGGSGVALVNSISKIIKANK